MKYKRTDQESEGMNRMKGKLGFGCMRLPVVNGDANNKDENAAQTMRN